MFSLVDIDISFLNHELMFWLIAPSIVDIYLVMSTLPWAQTTVRNHRNLLQSTKLQLWEPFPFIFSSLVHLAAPFESHTLHVADSVAKTSEHQTVANRLFCVLGCKLKNFGPRWRRLQAGVSVCVCVCVGGVVEDVCMCAFLSLSCNLVLYIELNK